MRKSLRERMDERPDPLARARSDPGVRPSVPPTISASECFMTSVRSIASVCALASFTFLTAGNARAASGDDADLARSARLETIPVSYTHLTLPTSDLV